MGFEIMWREVDVHLVRSSGFSTVRSGTWVSLERLCLSRVVRCEVDLLDGGWSCLELVAMGAVKELCDGVGCSPRVHIHRLILPPPRACTIICRRS